MNPPAETWSLVFFPDALVQLLITGSLVLTGLGAATLIWLLFKDRRDKQIW